MISRLRKTRSLRNILILCLTFLVIVGIYVNVRNSNAKEVTSVLVKLSDVEGKISSQEIKLSATENEDGTYSIKIPNTIEENIITDVYSEEGELLKTEVDNDKINLKLTKEQVVNNEIDIQVGYIANRQMLGTAGNKKCILKKSDEKTLFGLSNIPKTTINQLIFCSTKDVDVDNIGDTGVWDVSEAQDNSIRAYWNLIFGGDMSISSLYIVVTEDGEIYANEDSSYVFSNLGSSVDSCTISGLDLINTSDVTNMDAMFMNCNVETLDLGANFKWIANSHENMFKNCGSTGTKIYVPQEIYVDSTHIKLNKTSEEKIEITSGAEIKVNKDSISYTLKSTSKEVAYNSGFLGNDDISRNYIKSLTICDSKTITDKILSYLYWDVSEDQNDSIRAYYTGDKTNGYDIYIYNNANPGKEIYANTDSSNLFSYLGFSLKNLTISGLDLLNTSNVTNMHNFFRGCKNLTALDVSSFNTEKVINMSEMFYSCEKITKLDISSFNTKNVTDMSSMFYYCTGLKGTVGLNGEALIIGDNFNTSNVTDMNAMFALCSNVTGIDISTFNTSNVTNMGGMFSGCESLKGEVGTSGKAIKLGDDFNTSEVTNMSSLFSGCKELTELDLKKFDTKNVTDMSNMFYENENLLQLDVEKFDTKKVTNMGGMFSYCKKLEIIDLKNFDTSEVINTENMFNGCEALEELNLGDNFNTSNVKKMYFMFYECTELKTLNLGDKFTNIMDESSIHQIFAHCGKEGTVIYVPEEIYFNSTNIKLNEASEETVEIKTGARFVSMSITPNGNSKYDGMSNVKVKVANPNDGINVLYYYWSSDENEITDDKIYMEGMPFESEESIELPSRASGIFYLWILIENPEGEYIKTRSNAFYIDNIAPVVTFSPNGNTTYSKVQSTNVTVTDTGCGVDLSSLKYMWAQKSTVPDESQFQESFTNGGTVSTSNNFISGNNWCLWILAKDTAGNRTIKKSNAFYVDNTAPTISISPNSSDITKTKDVVITVMDANIGTLDIANEYQYYLSTSRTEQIGGSWQNYTSGTKFTIGDGLNGVYYLHVKGISDSLGNKSRDAVSGAFEFRNREPIEKVELTSESYSVDIANSKYIRGVRTNTSIIDFLLNIKTNVEAVRIFDKNKKEYVVEDSKICTGMEVNLNENDETLEILEIVIPGDINGDGRIKASDLSILKGSIAGKRTLEGAFREAADVSEDGNLKASDISRLKKMIIGE